MLDERAVCLCGETYKLETMPICVECADHVCLDCRRHHATDTGHEIVG
jgi:hypothetical protein